MRDFEIFCSGCGRRVSYQKAWRESLSKALVCGKECCDRLQLDYCAALIAKKPEEVHGLTRE